MNGKAPNNGESLSWWQRLGKWQILGAITTIIILSILSRIDCNCKEIPEITFVLFSIFAFCVVVGIIVPTIVIDIIKGEKIAGFDRKLQLIFVALLIISGIALAVSLYLT